MKMLATHLRRAVLLAALPTVALAQTAGRPAPTTRLSADGTPYLIRLPEAGSAAARTLPTTGAALLHQQLALGAADELRPLRQETDALGQRHEVFQQYYQGVKVEHGRYTIHYRQGRPELLTGEVKHPTLSTTPALGAAAARQRAEAAVGATRYMWQDAQAEQQLRALTGNPRATYLPAGELVLVEDFRRPVAARPLVLAWKFDIYAQQPLSRADVYVDARTGEIVLTNATIKHATGPAATRFSGTRTITTEQLSGPTRYRLAQPTRTRNGVSGNGIHTYNSAGTNTFATTDFIDTDNNWTAAEYNNAAKDNAALDAHWGAEVTFDYWADVHGRNSYDNAGARLISFVHYDSSPGDGVGMSNAFWNGSVMAYGDGSSLRPFTVLDVCGHEIAHAVCQATANLVYQNESGALNEGFSDIWGACIERYAAARYGPLPGKSTWLVGEELNGGGGLRSMSDPNAGSSPDTYGGTFWVTGTYDGGGVHYNSGVLNHWFYLLNEGGSGTNDVGFAYNVTGISPSGSPATLNDAARIAFRAESLYLTANATFAQARIATIQAAVDLFGAGSQQVVQVGNAWDAVGVRDASQALIITAFSPTQAAGSSAATITLTGSNFTGTTGVSFNGTPAPGFVVVNNTTLTVPLPAGASTGKIVVSKSGTRASSATDFIVNTGPLVSSISPASGPVSQLITITGQNFVAGATTVRVGGVPATNVVVSSATALTATVGLTTPAGPQPVVVTTAPGDSNPTVLYTVVVPAPTLTAFTPATGPPVGGGTLLVTGTDFGSSPLTVSVAGQPAPLVTVVSSTLLRVTLPPATAGTTGPVVVTTPGGTATSAGSYAYQDVLSLAYFSPDAGTAGTTVTLYGAQLAGTTDVLLNGVAATITGRTANSVRFVVPAGAPATGTTTVTTPTGSTSSPEFRVLLRLLGRSPASNGRAAPRANSGVQLTFSEPVTAATAANARVFSSQRGGRKAGTWSSSGTTFSFAAAAGTPQTDFLPGETVRVSLPATVQSAGGATLPAQMYQFTTATAGTGRGNLTAGTTATSDGNALTTNVGDIDGDGDLDLVLVSAGAPSIQTLLNGGDQTGSNTGVFSNGTRFSTSVRLNGSTLGDVDGDGDLDLLATTSFPNDLRVYLNNGLGAFSAGSVLATAFRTYDLSVGDLDGDGDLDVVTNNSNFALLTICLNNGNGIFSSGGTVATGPNPGNIALGDVDGDGDLDLACGLQENGDTKYAVAIHLNGGDNTGLNQGTFPKMQLVPVQAANCRSLLGDVDGDGDLDLLAVGVSGGRASLRLNGGDNTGSNTGNFLNGGNLLLPPAAANYWSGSLGDMDADGDLDLVLPSIASRSVYVLRNDGNGTFGNALTYPFTTTFDPYFAALGDLDGDGDLDVVATDVNRAPVHILLNHPLSVPLPVQLTTFTAVGVGPGAARLAWTTASEKNSVRFEVQRSPDGETFATIGTVAGQGHKNSPTSYSFLDTHLPTTTPQRLAYYRLQQVDADNAIHYSPVRTVALPQPTARLELAPNPARGHATLRGSTPGAEVQVFDALGRLVLMAAADSTGTSALQLPAGLPGGVYVVRTSGQSLRLLVK
ncbi:hypothetical protein HER32_03125 [Hymenobacter sp. BT18]|uniref:M4 family metallopeptidase n=1 Tax=Hymenobacter sp. BT18 TaxID=2835648 RepID=UPI00143E5EC1|nr:M4 family metallopeptidase [Hymenobacter sp. BT18]QIX60235.1 hypothetical protein HER32_03125 [Hymenobacter sp. BT18]